MISLSDLLEGARLRPDGSCLVCGSAMAPDGLCGGDCASAWRWYGSRSAWLSDREQDAARGILGATDGAAIVAEALSIPWWRTGWDVWASLQTPPLVAPSPTTEDQERGLWWESHILERYAHETGLDPDATLRRCWSRDVPWLRASPDAVVGDVEDPAMAPTLVEVKCPRRRDGWGPADIIPPGTHLLDLPVPIPYYIQAQIQLQCSGAIACDLVGAFSFSDLRIYHITYDVRLMAEVLRLLAAWRLRYVLGNEVPPPGQSGDYAAWARARERAGDVALPEALGDTLDLYETCGEIGRNNDRARKGYKNILLAALGDAEAGILPDGRRITIDGRGAIRVEKPSPKQERA